MQAYTINKAEHKMEKLIFQLHFKFKINCCETHFVNSSQPQKYTSFRIL